MFLLWSAGHAMTKKRQASPKADVDTSEVAAPVGSASGGIPKLWIFVGLIFAIVALTAVEWHFKVAPRLEAVKSGRLAS